MTDLEELKKLADAALAIETMLNEIGMAEWASLEHAEEILLDVINNYYPATRSALPALIERVEKAEAENARLIEALQNAKGLLDTPIARRRYGGSAHYALTVESLRAALGRQS